MEELKLVEAESDNPPELIDPIKALAPDSPGFDKCIKLEESVFFDYQMMSAFFLRFSRVLSFSFTISYCKLGGHRPVRPIRLIAHLNSIS